MKSEEGIHVLARAVIIHNDKLLVTTDVNTNVSFLPGGHVNYGEKIQDGLIRELNEELGQAFHIKQLLGVIEAGWDYKGQLYHEVNLIFAVDPLAETSLLNVRSQEEKLRLEWLPLHNLKASNLYPLVLRENIPQWIKQTPIQLFNEWSWNHLG